MQLKTTTLLTSLLLVNSSLAIPLIIGGLADVIGGLIGTIPTRRSIDGPAGHVARNSADITYAEPAVVEVREPVGDVETQAEDEVLEKRQSCGQAPAGVPQNVIDNCCNALRGKTLRVDPINTGKGKSCTAHQHIPERERENEES